MKRNMDLIREILLQVEANTDGKIVLDLPDYQANEIGLHVELMIERGLVEGTTLPSRDGPAHEILSYVIERMTWDGYEFLEVARNDALWKKAKSICVEKTGGLAFEQFVECLKRVASDAISIGVQRHLA